jgi:hypothetical protein
MPRTINIEEIIAVAVSQAIAKAGPAIQRRIAELAAQELAKNIALDGKGSRGPARRASARGVEITKWIADRRARRVPIFVIEMTGGLDTKKKIVAKFGENATFEKGKPLPKAVKAA